MIEEKYLNYWVVLADDGKVDTGDISTIYGLDYNQCTQCIDALLEMAQDVINDNDIPSDTLSVEFKVTNFEWFEGQMTFPETGQWDFAPGWEFDMEITGCFSSDQIESNKKALEDLSQRA